MSKTFVAYLGSVKNQAELQKQFSSPSAFKKAVQGEIANLPDGSKWRRIERTVSNRLLWQGEPSNAVLFECIEVVEAKED